MELETKIRVQSKLIQDLKTENDDLKRKLSEAEIKLTLSQTSYDETLEQARQVIVAGKQASDEYNQAIQEVREIKRKLDSDLQEIYKIKQKYHNAIDSVVKQI